jgi:hypothetical protein
LVLGALAFLLAVAFSNIVFAGKSLVLTDNFNPMDDRLMAANYGADFVPGFVWSRRGLAPTSNVHDPGATWWQWEPAGAFLRNSIADRELPFWDPYVGAGTPSMANLTPAFFFPPYFLMVLLGNTAILKNTYFLLLLLIAGAFTYLLLRRHAMSPLSALGGAVTYMFCGDLVTNMSSFIGQASACLPVVLFVTSYYVDRPSWRRAGVLALVYAMVALSSFPPILLGIFGFACLYVVAAAPVWRHAEDPAVAGTLARFAVGATAALCIAAVYYLPAILAARECPQVAAAYHGAGSVSLRKEAALQLIDPVLMGGEQTLVPAPVTGPLGHLHYVGIIAMLLAFGVPLRQDKRRPLVGVAFVVGLCVLLKLLGVPPIQWLGLLPGLRAIHFAAYFGVFVAFAVSVLAASGLEAIGEGRLSGWRVVWMIGFGMCVLGTLLAVAIVKGVSSRPNGIVWFRHWILVFSLGTGVVLVAFAASSLSGRRANLVRGVVIVLMGLQGIAYSYYPRQYVWDVWRNPVPYVQLLIERAGTERVLDMNGFKANVNSAFSVSSLDSCFAFNPPRPFELYRRYLGPVNTLFMREAVIFPSEILLDRAAIGFLALSAGRTRAIREASQRGYEKLFDDDHTLIFRRRAASRYFFTTKYRILDAEHALEEVGSGADPKELILEQLPSFPPSENSDTDPPVEIAQLRRNSVSLRVNAPRAGMVYAAEAQFPGWTARVNGRTARIVHANYAFRAVEVPAGPATIEMGYRPAGLGVGFLITLGGAGFVLIALVKGSRHPSVSKAEVPTQMDSNERSQPKAFQERK